MPRTWRALRKSGLLSAARITPSALNKEGLRVSGKHDFSVKLKATANPAELPDFDLGIVATKATQVEASIRFVGGRFDKGAVLSAQNGLGK